MERSPGTKEKSAAATAGDGLTPVAGLVSIVIPTYNYASYLHKALQSCLQQSYSKIEVIIVDDGSTDHTREVAESFGRDVVYLHQENKGVSAARNAGLERASGEFITFLDSDDYLTADSIQLRVDVLLAYPEIGAVTGEILSKHVSSERISFRPATKRAFTSERLCEEVLLRGFSGSVLLRGSHARQFRFPLHITNGEDIAYYAKVFFATKVRVLPDPVLVKVRHPGCLSRDIEKIAKQEASLISTIMDDSYYAGALEYLRQEFAARRYLSLFRSLYRSGDFRASRKYYLKALRTKPTSLFRLRYLTKFLEASWRNLFSREGINQ